MRFYDELCKFLCDYIRTIVNEFFLMCFLSFSRLSLILLIMSSIGLWCIKTIRGIWRRIWRWIWRFYIILMVKGILRDKLMWLSHKIWKRLELLISILVVLISSLSLFPTFLPLLNPLANLSNHLLQFVMLLFHLLLRFSKILL